MTSANERVLRLDSLRSFFMGRKYPLIIATLVASGSILGVEAFTVVIHSVLVLYAIFVTNSLKPVIISLLTFVMQISVKHAPFHPTNSDYYYTGWRLPAFIITGSALVAGLVFFVIRNKLYKRLSFKQTPLMTSLLVFSSGLILGGVGSDSWCAADLVYGVSNAFVYLVTFLVFYYGISDDSDSLADYFSYASALTALVIISELAALFIRSDEIIVDGAINKTAVSLGWGIWTLVGISLSVLIPMIFYAAEKGSRPVAYTAVATLTLVFAALSMSRNALVTASLAYASSLAYLSIFGERRRFFRRVALLELLTVALAFPIVYERVRRILSDYFERGFSDNGRFKLWRFALKSFSERMLFGNGFSGLVVSDELLYPFGPLVKQAHNTIIQLLSATGIFGTASYIYYRIESLKPIFRAPSTKTVLAGVSVAVLLIGSLADNFVFNIYPTFHYTISMVIIHKTKAEEDAKNN